MTQAYDWEHGVFLGSIMASETTAAQQGAVGKLRFDPMAMLPFCGYNMADYFAHWLSIGKTSDSAEAAGAVLRQLVPPRRRRPLPVARLRREQPRAEVGLRARRRRRRRGRDADRSAARSRCTRHRPGSTSATTTSPNCSPSTSTVGARRSRRSASTTPASATTSRRRSLLAVDTLERRLADA